MKLFGNAGRPRVGRNTESFEPISDAKAEKARAQARKKADSARTKAYREYEKSSASGDRRTTQPRQAAHAAKPAAPGAVQGAERRGSGRRGGGAKKAVIITVCVLAVIFAGITGFAFYVSGTDTIYPNVSIGGVDLGGLTVSEAAYELSTNNMRDTKLLAPFDGSIEKRLVENYQRVNSGDGIVRLVNTQKRRIKFTVPDDYLYLLRAKDATFKVEFDTYKGNIFNARLEEYLDISTDGTGIPVTIIIDDPAFDRAVYDVKPGFTCNIRLASDIAPFIEEKLMNVPLSAVFGDSENKNTYVWVVKDNRVSRREVTVYSPTGEANILISKGLKPDETVVIAGVYQLVEGQRVKEVE